MMNITPVVKQLIIINIIFFIGSLIIKDHAYDLLALHNFNDNKFKPWQLISHFFMHAAFPEVKHIVFNMLGLYMFGSPLEHFWGGKKFIYFYISCGLGAGLIQLGVNYYELQQVLNTIHLDLTSLEINQLLNADFTKLFDEKGHLINSNVKTILDITKCSQEQFNSIVQANDISKSTMVGASGAIYGLMAAFAFMLPDSKMFMLFLPFPIKAKYFVPLIVASDLFSGITGTSIFGGGNIAHFAHVGGAVVGFLIMLYWRNNKFKQNRWN